MFSLDGRRALVTGGSSGIGRAMAAALAGAGADVVLAADLADREQVAALCEPPAMASRGWGRIVHVGSQQSWRAFGNSGAYGAAKAGVTGLTRSQAEAWSPSGVTVNCVIPAFVRTAMTERIFVEEPDRADGGFSVS